MNPFPAQVSKMLAHRITTHRVMGCRETLSPIALFNQPPKPMIYTWLFHSVHVVSAAQSDGDSL